VTLLGVSGAHMADAIGEGKLLQRLPRQSAGFRHYLVERSFHWPYFQALKIQIIKGILK
jgi:hypothetical protein